MMDMTQSDHNESIQTLLLFNEKADKLKRGSFTSIVFKQTTGVQVSASIGEPVTVRRCGPDEDSINSFVLTYRYFIQNNESISFKNFADLYSDLPISKAKKNTFDEIRTAINKFLDSTSNVNIDNSTNRYLMDIFIYGGLAHAKPEKKKVFDQWMSKPIVNTLLINEFVYIMGIIMIAIEDIKNLNSEVIKELSEEQSKIITC